MNSVIKYYSQSACMVCIFSYLLQGTNYPIALYDSASDDLHMYVWATYNSLEKKHATTAKAFNHLINKQTTPVYAYIGYIEYLFANNRFKEIIALENVIKNKLSDIVTPQLILIKAFEITGNTKIADHYLQQLYSKYPLQSEIAFMYTVSLVRNHKAEDALKTIEEYLQNTSDQQYNFLFYFLSAQLHARTNNLQAADKYIQKAVKYNPHFPQGWLFAAMIAELQGNIKHALHRYTQVLDLTGSNVFLENHMSSLLYKLKSEDYANNFEKALFLYKNRQLLAALTAIQDHLQKNPHHLSGQILEIEILCSTKQYVHAYEKLKDHLQKQPDNQTWLKTAFLFYKSSIYKPQLIAFLKNLEKQHTNPTLLLYVADIAIKEKEYTTAIAYLERIVNDTRLSHILPKALYHMIAMYFDTRQFDKIASLVKQGLSKNISFSPFLNSAAYFYATHSSSLDQAQQLISKALLQDPENIAYLDTQALIWYKQGDYKKAEQLFTSLLTKDPTNFYISKHLAKTFHKQGKTVESYDIIRRAMDLTAPTHEKEKLHKIIALYEKK